MKEWSQIRLGEVLTRSDEAVALHPDTTYREITVRLWGKGVVARGTVTGAEVAAQRRHVARQGQLILSRIDARNGALGIVPQELDGAIITNDFPVFRVAEHRLLPAYLGWLGRTASFWENCRRASEGTTNRIRLQEEKFLAMKIPLPPLAEQRRIVARVEEFATYILEARTLCQRAAEEAAAILGAHLNHLFGDPYSGTAGALAISHWQKLDAVVEDVADGPHVTPTYVQQGIPFITVLNITSGRIRFDDHKFITPEAHAQYQRRAKAEKGDVLISKDGTIGVPCFVDTDREFSFFVSVALIKPKRSVLSGEFLVWALRTPYLQDRILQRSRGDMIRHLVLREIRDLTVPVPPLNEQRRLVAKLDTLQTEVARLKRLQAETTVELHALLPVFLNLALNGDL